MGTSTGYSAPSSWSDLKGQVTRAAGDPTRSHATTASVVRSFIRHSGGSTAIARSGGTLGQAKAAHRTASSVASFVAGVAANGLSQALVDAGWPDLVGLPVSDLLNALIDRLAGDSSTIDDVDARNALARLEDRLLQGATTVAQVETVLAAQAADLQQLLSEFFGYYIFEQFCRVFFERLTQRVGELQARDFLGDIESLIAATLANRTAGQDLSTIDWRGKEGESIVGDIMETTLHVFELEK